MSVEDWRTPRVKAKRALAKLVLKGGQALGRYQRPPPSAREMVQTDTVPFLGDIPRGAGPVASQRRMAYRQPRPAIETASDLIYTPSGHAWTGGKLVEAFSVRAPSAAEMLRGPGTPSETLEEVCLIESETPYTYGDWVGDFIRALVETGPLPAPLLLPADLADKAYVQRDLAQLGLSLIAAKHPVHVRRTHVLRKQIPSYSWGPDQVAAYRRRFGINLVDPAPGSLVYLSREHVASEAIERDYPSALVSDIVRGLGGQVFDTRHASPDAFKDLAPHVETVIADQGSAVFGVLQWKTRSLIEITQEDWWHNANLFFSHGAGVQNHAILVCDRDGGIEARLHSLLDLVGYPARD